MSGKKASKPSTIGVELRLRVTVGGEHVIGPGKIALLEAVRTHGSITAAARSLGMSYPRAWRLLDELNRHLKVPAMHSSKGGESGGQTTLTTVGEELIRHYRSIELAMPQACANNIQGLVRLAKVAEPPPVPTTPQVAMPAGVVPRLPIRRRHAATGHSAASLGH